MFRYYECLDENIKRCTEGLRAKQQKNTQLKICDKNDGQNIGNREQKDKVKDYNRVYIRNFY